jgi:peptidoglycan/LPS O-acetylase OafA/YrhL
MKHRNHAIDWLRALSVLYIVGYWHLFNYTPGFTAYFNIYTECLKDVVLGTFTLTSGYLLATRPISTITEFYYRRMIRIYPLYIMTLALFLWHGLINSKVMFTGTLLISMFAPPSPPTLWFITMMVIFYLIAPLLIKYANQLIVYIILCGIIMISMANFSIFIQHIDLRILKYFPAFAIGIIMAKNQFISQLIDKYHWLIATLFIIAFWIFPLGKESSLLGIITLIPSTVIGSVIAFIYAKHYLNNFNNHIITLISYASFCMYLLHRIVFLHLVKLYFPDTLLLQTIYLFVFGVSITFIVSYFVQKTYDTGLAMLGYKF